MQEKDMNITEVRGAKANITDLNVYGDGDTFALLCKASSQSQGWMKSTKVCNVEEGCIVQVTTQQKNPDGSYSVAEALTYVPGMNIDLDSEPRRLVPISNFKLATPLAEVDDDWKREKNKRMYFEYLLEAKRSGVMVDEEIKEQLNGIREQF